MEIGARIRGAVLLLLAALPGSARAQAAPAPEVALSADTVAIGEAFELRLTLTVPPGSTVHFPDTLPATEALESLAPARWQAEPTDAGGARITLIYALMAFRAGLVPVPGLDVLVSPRRSATAGEPLPGGSGIGVWADAPAAVATAAPGELRRWRIARRAVQVAPPFTPEELAAGPQPMPPDDVLGGSWHWPSLTLALLLSVVLAGAIVQTVQGNRRLRGAGPMEAVGPEAARRAALAALDRLLADGLHARGQMRVFHARASAIVRRYVESLAEPWGPDLTSTELMRALERELRARSAASDERADAGADAPLLSAMATAEVVKFGRWMPTPAEAEACWRALRSWIELHEERPGTGGPS